jgi:hypothetical protein
MGTSTWIVMLLLKPRSSNFLAYAKRFWSAALIKKVLNPEDIWVLLSMEAPVDSWTFFKISE